MLVSLETEIQQEKDIRQHFPFFKHNPDIVYLDSAATALKPKMVLDALQEYYEKMSVNIHRGVYSLSAEATEIYESTRTIVQKFIQAPSTWEIIFTRGTTTSLNLLAYSFLKVKDELKPFFHAWQEGLGKGDVIVLSESEHHSNIVPWQFLSELTGAKIFYLPVHKNGTLDLSPLASSGDLFSDKIKIISLSAMSNVSGVIHDLAEIRDFARKKGAVFIVDAAQAVCHTNFSCSQIGADFIAFSGHKLGGPTGVGVLAGQKDILRVLPPFEGGGDMILRVNKEKTTYNEPPHRFEAGTPPIGEVFGLRKAIEFMQIPFVKEKLAQEKELTIYCMEVIEKVGGTLYGPSIEEVLREKVKKTGVVAFGINGIHPNDIGTLLDEQKICIRTGHHCCQLLMDAWGLSSTARASLFLYNRKEDIDYLGEALQNIKKIFKKI